MNPFELRENVYGIVKRLNFFIKFIEMERERLNLDSASDLHILDVGCGTGVNITIPLAARGYSLVGIDSDRPSIELGRYIAREYSTKVEFSDSNLEMDHLADSFHCIICSEVLEHLDRPELLVRQMKSILKNNGLLLVTVPNGYGYFEMESFIEHLFPKLNPITDKLQKNLIKKLGGEELKVRHELEMTPEYTKFTRTTLSSGQEHVQRFTEHRIKELLNNEGFSILEFRNRTFLAGNILGNLVRDWDGFLRWNADGADHLPPWACSGWMIAARRNVNRNRESHGSLGD